MFSFIFHLIVTFSVYQPPLHLNFFPLQDAAVHNLTSVKKYIHDLDDTILLQYIYALSANLSSLIDVYLISVKNRRSSNKIVKVTYLIYFRIHTFLPHSKTLRDMVTQ